MKSWSSKRQALHQQTSKRQTLDSERLKMLQIRTRGRRQGILVTKSSPVVQQTSAPKPVCPRCTNVFARHYCNTCLNHFCDSCWTLIHVRADRRHHVPLRLEEANKGQVLNRPLPLPKATTAASPSKTEEDCSSHALTIAQEIKTFLSTQLKMQSNNVVPFEPKISLEDDLELQHRATRARLGAEKSIQERCQDSLTQAAHLAKSQGLSIFHEPAEMKLIKVLMHQDRLEEAQEVLDDVTQIQTQAFGPAHLALASTYEIQGQLSDANTDLDRAIASYERARAIYSHEYPVDHAQVRSNLSLLDDLLMKHSRYHDVMTLWLGVQRERCHLLGRTHFLVAEAQARMEIGRGFQEFEFMYAHDRVAHRRRDWDENGARYRAERKGQTHEQFTQLLLLNTTAAAAKKKAPMSVWTLFEDFVAQKLGRKNLKFWIDLHEYERLFQDDEVEMSAIRTKAFDIFHRYIQPRKEIPCLTNAIRGKIRTTLTTSKKKKKKSDGQALRALKPALFHAAQDLVFQNMYDHIYLPFIDSSVEATLWYRDLLVVNKYSRQLVLIQHAWRACVFRRQIERQFRERRRERRRQVEATAKARQGKATLEPDESKKKKFWNRKKKGNQKDKAGKKKTKIKGAEKVMTLSEEMQPLVHPLAPLVQPQ